MIKLIRDPDEAFSKMLSEENLFMLSLDDDDGLDIVRKMMVYNLHANYLYDKDNKNYLSTA
jgi:hypothetical protein